jgi:hypothetical protein
MTVIKSAAKLKANSAEKFGLPGTLKSVTDCFVIKFLLLQFGDVPYSHGGTAWAQVQNKSFEYATEPVHGASPFGRSRVGKNGKVLSDLSPTHTFTKNPACCPR